MAESVTSRLLLTIRPDDTTRLDPPGTDIVRLIPGSTRKDVQVKQTAIVNTQFPVKIMRSTSPRINHGLLSRQWAWNNSVWGGTAKPNGIFFHVTYVVKDGDNEPLSGVAVKEHPTILPKSAPGEALAGKGSETGCKGWDNSLGREEQWAAGVFYDDLSVPVLYYGSATNVIIGSNYYTLSYGEYKDKDTAVEGGQLDPTISLCISNFSLQILGSTKRR